MTNPRPPVRQSLASSPERAVSTSSIWSRFRPRPRNTLFLGIHIAAPIVAWMAGFSWFGVLLALVVYYVRVFGITAGIIGWTFGTIVVGISVEFCLTYQFVNVGIFVC